MDLVVFQAYNRITNSDSAKAKTDWDNGKDFHIQNGPYCSNRDIEAMKRDGYKKVICIHPSSEILFTIEL